MKSTGILLESLLVRVKAWDTYATLPATTRLRGIKRRGKVWQFEAATHTPSRWPIVWTACTTKHDLQKSLGLT